MATRPTVFAIMIPMLYPFLVPLGLRWPLNALMLMNIDTLGYDFVGTDGCLELRLLGATAGVLVLSMRDGQRPCVRLRPRCRSGPAGGISRPHLWRSPPALQAHLPADVGGMFRQRCLTIAILGSLATIGQERRRCRRRSVRLHLAADDPGLCRRCGSTRSLSRWP